MIEKKRIPFNLERALAGDKVVTRDGREVTEIYHFKTVQHAQPVKAVVDGDIQDFCINGCFLFKNDKRENHYDLFMAPKIKTYWVNVFYNNSGEPVVSQFLHDEESQARLASRDPSYIKTISFEIEQCLERTK